MQVTCMACKVLSADRLKTLCVCTFGTAVTSYQTVGHVQTGPSLYLPLSAAFPELFKSCCLEHTIRHYVICVININRLLMKNSFVKWSCGQRHFLLRYWKIYFTKISHGHSFKWLNILNDKYYWYLENTKLTNKCAFVVSGSLYLFFFILFTSSSLR